ncbi:MAG: hypothetical protein NZ840_05140 [Anaerolineales bacterium]|nr:hypothetical protein [Anaerolineales bacterium]MDW8161422.1 hypothetical protein [Anaerolineales bacterium]
MLKRWVLLFPWLFLWLACQVPLPASFPLPRFSPWGGEPFAVERAPTLPPGGDSCCQVRLHPEERLYIGDQVSFEVIAPSKQPYLNQPLTVTLTTPPALIGSTTFQPYGFDRRTQATLLWAWDTRTLLAGEYTLNFSIPGLKKQWRQTVTLLPRSTMPLEEQTARWQTLSVDCCEVHFITNTAAHRQIEEIAEVVEREYRVAQAQIPVSPEERLSVVLIPRVLGNGGFANAEVNVSFLDRNYTAGDFATILRHEIVHVLDGQARPDPRPSLFVEGIAVYLSEGHYFPEALSPRAAELVRLQKYVPLRELATNFYEHQHEIAYLEAGALVEYLARRWGWGKAWETYLEMSLREGESQLAAIERALKTQLGLSLQELERDFLADLAATPQSNDLSWNLLTMERYYEVLRAYQRQLDPSAYYRTAWMLDGRQMRQKGVVADYFRHPRRTENLVLELLLNETGRAQRAGDYVLAERRVQAVERVLNRLEQGLPAPFAADPIAEDAWEVVQVLLAAGYEPQTWSLDGQRAQVRATRGASHLIEIVLEKQSGTWQIRSRTSAAGEDLIYRAE